MFQFLTEFKLLVEQHNPAALRIAQEFITFLGLLTRLDNLLLIIEKSHFTAKITEVDTLRDTNYNSLKAIVKVYTNHFDPAKKEAAYKLSIVFDRYGDVAREGYSEETGSLTNILQELRNNYSYEINLLSLNEWLVEIENNNDTFQALMASRDADKAIKPKDNMVDLRKLIYENYIDMIDRLSAIILINGMDPPYTSFVDLLNVCITRHNNTIAIREGSNAAKKTVND